MDNKLEAFIAGFFIGWTASLVVALLVVVPSSETSVISKVGERTHEVVPKELDRHGKVLSWELIEVGGIRCLTLRCV